MTVGRTWLLFWMVAAAAVPAAAQIDVNYQSVNDLTVQEPRTSRSAAMGGTGLALGDDLSAPVLNPATLGQLVRGEIVADFNYPTVAIPTIVGGTVARPSFAALPAIPASLEIADHQLANAVEGPSYFAFAYPTRWFTAAGYWRYVELGTPFPTGITEIPVGGSLSRFTLQPVPANGGTGGTVNGVVAVGSGGGQVSRIELGAAAAIPIGAHLSLGGVSAWEGTDVNTVAQFGVGTQQLPPGARVAVSTRDNRSYDPAFTVGATWSQGRVHVGAAHHRGAKHQFATTGVVTPSTTISQTAVFRTPDWTGGGIGVRISETLRVAADVRQVAYSQMLEGLAGLILQSPTAFRVADATEVRVGAEYAIPFQSASVRSLALRGGIWRDPSHALIYTGTDPLTGPLLGELFTDRIGDRVHGTGGVGLTVSRFEFNLAADAADRYRAISGSVVVRFK